MNVKDYAKINRIMGYFSPQLVAIKIVDGKSPEPVLDSFKKDLELFNSAGANNQVYQVSVYGSCLVRIILKDNATPVVYYFSTGFSDAEAAISRIRNICDELDIKVEDMDSSIIGK